jgi:hypothetical protein
MDIILHSIFNIDIHNIYLSAKLKMYDSDIAWDGWHVWEFKNVSGERGVTPRHSCHMKCDSLCWQFLNARLGASTECERVRVCTPKERSVKCLFGAALRCSNVISIRSRRCCDEMRWDRKPELTLLSTQGTFRLPHHIYMVWEKLAFDNAVHLHSWGIECKQSRMFC